MEIIDELNINKYLPDKHNMFLLARLFNAFSDETRLKIVILLMIKPLCVGEISNMLKINQTTISHQLKYLKNINLIDCERSGKNIIYFIKNNRLENVFDVAVDCI